MKSLALVTAITTHQAGNARHGAAWALKHDRFHFGPGAERAVQSGQILAHRERDGIHVYLVTAGYPVAKDEDGCDVYEDWCFAVLGISRRKFFAPLRSLRAMMLAHGDGKSAAWALVRASQAAAIGYHCYPDCHRVVAVVDRVAVVAATATTPGGASVTIKLTVPPSVSSGLCHHEDGDCDETLPIASLGRGFSRHPVTNPSRLARRRLGPVA